MVRHVNVDHLESRKLGPLPPPVEAADRTVGRRLSTGGRTQSVKLLRRAGSEANLSRAVSLMDDFGRSGGQKTDHFAHLGGASVVSPKRASTPSSPPRRHQTTFAHTAASTFVGAERERLGTVDLSASLPSIKVKRHGIQSPTMGQAEEQRRVVLRGSGHTSAAPSHGEAAAPEVQSWISNTLASLPSRRKSLGTTSVDSDTPPYLLPNEGTWKGESDKPGTSDSRKPSKEKRKRSLTTEKENSYVLPMPEVLLWLQAGHEGFLPSQVMRLRTTYNRFKTPDADGVKKDELPAAMHHLGHAATPDEVIRKIADEVTIYSTLDFRDFILFAEKLTEHEYSHYREAFGGFVEDGGDRVPKARLRQLMVSIGFMLTCGMFREALQLVDTDQRGALTFKQFMQLVTMCRHSEGFTSAELGRLNAIFTQHAKPVAGDHELPAHTLEDVLVCFYGPQSLKLAKLIGSEATVVKVNPDIDKRERETAAGLKFPEVLIWARRLRDAELQVYVEAFAAHDTGGSGSIDLAVFRAALRTLGYTVTVPTIDECLKGLEEDGGRHSTEAGRIDCDEFVSLVLILRKQDGFLKAEIEEMRRAFDRFDAAGDGHVRCIELCDMVRYVGYATNFEEAQNLIAEAKLETNGSVDFQRNLRFMRLHREKFMAKLSEAFKSHADAGLGGLPASSIWRALADLGFDGLEGAGKEGNDNFQNQGLELECLAPPGGVVGLDDFIQVVDRCRAIRFAQQRRRAGFSEAEVGRFHKQLAKYDNRGSGFIGVTELNQYLSDLGFKIATIEERELLLANIEAARAAASAIGVRDTGEAGTPLNMWVVVQVLRIMYNRDDRLVLDRESRAVEQTRFTADEVREFREIFINWHTRDNVFNDTHSPATSFNGGSVPLANSNDTQDLSKDCMRRLIRSLGTVLNCDQRVMLEQKIDELNAFGRVDFADFLRVMRWMLDTNFANVHSTAAKAAHG